MMSWAILFFRSLFKKREEDQKEEREELPTVRQSLINIAALLITAFIGIMLLPVVDYVMVLLLKLVGG